jgi:Glycosyltransferase
LLVTPTSYIADILGINRYVVVPHGVNPDIFKPIDKQNSKLTLGMIAKNHPRKRWDIFFDVAYALAKKYSNIKVLPYVFDIGYWNISQLVASLSEYYNVRLDVEYIVGYDTFFGVPESEQPEIYSRIHIHALISMGEAWALPVTETLAMSIPNLVVDFPALREIYHDTVVYSKPKGIHIAPQECSIHPLPDPEDIYNKLVDMIEHYEEYKEKALKASEWIRKNYTWENAVKYMIDAIDKVQQYDNAIIEEENPKPKIDLKPKMVE